MTIFATEFPVRANPNRAAFVAEVIAWLRGTRYSSVLDSGTGKELDGDNAHLSSPAGEELRLREFREGDDWSAIGFRHDFPDNEGRLWRTEAVLRRAVAEVGQDVVRLRTQCLAKAPGARLESPRKPYLVKGLLKNGWGDTDGLLAISDVPVWLDGTEESLSVARAVTLGQTVKWLPTVYVSSAGKGAWSLDRDEIGKLAYDLGGIAHVVVEPDRAFSFLLRDETEGRNAYGGSVGLSIPGQGIVRRYFLGWQIQNGRELATAVRAAAFGLRSQMPAFGWDWTELQESALRAQRQRDKNRLTAEDNEKLFLEEIKNLEDRIRELEQQRDARPVDGFVANESEFSTDNLIRLIEPEIYAGEVSDRLRLAAKTTLSMADNMGLDARSKIILQRLLDRVPLSPALAELSEDIGRATKDSKRVAKELEALLCRHGYRKKSDNKHPRLEAADDYDGLETLTLSKTPSDHRGLKNLRSQIEATLGITNLKK